MFALLALLVASPVAPPAALAHYQKLMGHATPAHHAVHLVWKGHAYGVPGTVSEDLSATRWRSRTVLPSIPFEDTVVVEGTRATERDTNGFVRRLEGNGRAALLTTQAVLSGTWVTAGTSTPLPADPKGRQRLRFVPKDGATAVLTFAADGSLAELAVDTGGGQMARTTFSGWHLVDGVRLPSRQVYHDPGYQTPEVWRLVRVTRFHDRPFPKMRSRVDWHLPKGRTSVTLPLSLFQGRWIQVPVTIGGVHTIFILDTGASSTVISISLAKRLHLPLKGTLTFSAGLFKGMYYVRAPSLEVGGARVDPQTVIALDLTHGAIGAYLPGIGGILGYDFLSRFVTRIDYPASRLGFSARSTFRPAAGDVAIPVKLDGAALTVPVRVNGHPATFLLDTGNGSGVVVQHVKGQRSWVTPAEAKRFYAPHSIAFGSGIAGGWQAYADFAVGPFEWHHAPVAIVDEASAKGSSLTTQGNVGAGLLRHFRVTLDMGTPRLWLAQEVPFRDRAHYATYGFVLTAKGKEAVVLSVDVGGPAAKAGLAAGDVIEKVDGMEATRILGYLADVIKDPLPGERLHLVVRRGKKQSEQTVSAEVVP